ncbi:MAG: phosphonate ABC transporter, permease protein PhnE [Bacillota bacterium]|nr:phosphonate ABC transporter, permease protein PhnE [Bacillota bacterium]
MAEEAPRIPIPWAWYGGGLLSLAVIFISSWHLQIRPQELLQGLPQMIRLFQEFLHPDVSYLKKVLPALLDTLRMAIGGTAMGAFFSFPLLFWAAKNTAPAPWVYHLSRFLLNFLRTLPELLLAALFVAVVGLGMMSGLLAIAIFSLGIIGKLASEKVETIDPGPLEALQAVGAPLPVRILWAAWPQMSPDWLSYTLYTLEINIRAATILGLVGAGGIGSLLTTAMKSLAYPKVAAILLAVFFMVLLVEGWSSFMRRRIL